MMIHETAIVDASARLGKNVKIGPYCIVSEGVVLGDDVELKSHVCIGSAGITDIGDGTVIYPFACIGYTPQDHKYKGERSNLIIGQRNVIREHVTIHPGTDCGRGVTTIGNDNLFMISCHIAHDCKIGNDCVIVNNVALAGHVEVHDFAIIGGNSAVHQYARIGKYSMVGGMSAVVNDVPPFALALSVSSSRDARIRGVNLVGLKRRNFSRDAIRTIVQAYDVLFSSAPGTDSLKTRLQELEITHGDDENVKCLLEFISNAETTSIAKWYQSKNEE